MNKTEKTFKALYKEPVIGKTTIIEREDGMYRTSPIEHFITSPNNDMTIITQNTIYTGTNIKKCY